VNSDFKSLLTEKTGHKPRPSRAALC